MMNKKILLGAAISLASLQVTALPFAPTDARGMAMGGTGVASSKTVHSVQYNPSLLSGGHESDDFGLLLPQLGGYVADEDEFIDSADDFADADYAEKFNIAIKGVESSPGVFNGGIEEPLNNIKAALQAVNDASAAENLAQLNIATGVLNGHVGDLTTGTNTLTIATADLNGGLASISEKALRGGVGGGAGIAIPSKKFSVAISANNSTSFSGKLSVSQSDMDLLTDYTSATNAYALTLADYTSATTDLTAALTQIKVRQDASEAPTQAELDAVTNAQGAVSTANTSLVGFNYSGTAGNAIFVGGALAPGADDIALSSTVSLIAIAISEVAISISREFTIADRQVAIGITPKLQRVDAYNYIVSVEDDTDTDNISDYAVEDTGFNLDIGASTKFGYEDRGTAGLVIKNIISRDVQTTDNNPLTTNDAVVSISPQVRAGVSYAAWGWLHLAADLDLMENDPVAFEDGTQFAAFGAEADVLSFLQVRTGFRTNLAASDQEVVSFGLGISPFSLFHMDLGLYANVSDPKKEAGAVFELGIDW